MYRPYSFYPENKMSLCFHCKDLQALTCHYRLVLATGGNFTGSNIHLLCMVQLKLSLKQ